MLILTGIAHSTNGGNPALSKTIQKLLLAAALQVASGQAAVLYSSLGPGGTFSTAKYGLDGNTGLLAVPFQPTVSGSVSTITAALAHQSPPAVTHFDLYDGTATSLGTLLETFVVNQTSTTIHLVAMSSTVHPFLNAGSNYWLAMREPNAADGQNSYWAFNNLNLFATMLRPPLSPFQGSLPAFQVNSAQVDLANTPEPGTGSLIALAGLAVCCRMRRRLPSDR